MEARTYVKNGKITPKKLRFLMPKIKKMKPAQALDYLFYSPLKGSTFFYKAIKSAITNANNTLKSDTNLLTFKVLKIDEGQKLRRYRPGGRGTSKPFKRRTAHITIVLEAKQPVVEPVNAIEKAALPSGKTETKQTKVKITPKKAEKK